MGVLRRQVRRQAAASMLMVSVLRISGEPAPVIGRTECHELKVLTNTTTWFGRELERVEHLHLVEIGLGVHAD